MFAVVAVVNIQSLILKKHEEFLPFKLFIMKNTEFIYFFYCVLPQSHTIWENFFYLYYYFFLWISFATLKYQTIILKLEKHYWVFMEMPWMNISRQWNSDHRNMLLLIVVWKIIHLISYMGSLFFQIFKFKFYSNKTFTKSLNFILYQYYLNEITSCKFI